MSAEHNAYGSVYITRESGTGIIDVVNRGGHQGTRGDQGGQGVDPDFITGSFSSAVSDQMFAFLLNFFPGFSAAHDPTSKLIAELEIQCSVTLMPYGSAFVPGHDSERVTALMLVRNVGGEVAVSGRVIDSTVPVNSYELVNPRYVLDGENGWIFASADVDYSSSLGYPVSGSSSARIRGTLAWAPFTTTVHAVLNVYNSNNILDDSWDFFLNDQFVMNYNGDGSANVSWEGDFVTGSTLTLTAFCVAEQSDNLFRVTLTVDGEVVIDDTISDVGGGQFHLVNPPSVPNNYQVGDGGVVGVATIGGGPALLPPVDFQNDTSMPILDLQDTVSTINVDVPQGGHGSATSMVAVNITHTWDGDVQITLQAPSGTLYVLRDQTGGDTDDIIESYTVDLSGELVNGDWNLIVHDWAEGDEGTLNAWGMTI